MLRPSNEGVQLVVKEIHHRARVYSMLDIAALFLASPERYVLDLEVEEGHPPIYVSLRDASAFATRNEAVEHFMNSQLFEDCYETEEIECDPPAGNFQVVARCGISGEWLGPPNFHAYQSKLRQLHRERFSNMPFERYAGRVQMERSEEMVEAWRDTMRRRTRWRRKGAAEEAWLDDREAVVKDFTENLFEKYFEECRSTTIPGKTPHTALSEGILATTRMAASRVRHRPVMLIPRLCKMLEAERLAIFKRQGKIFCGPARPSPLEHFEDLAERPAAIVSWLDAHEGAKLKDLWHGVLPDTEEEPAREWLLDLFWLLSQGHVLLFADDVLVLPKRRPATEAKPAGEDRKRPKTGKKKKSKIHTAGEASTDEASKRSLPPIDGQALYRWNHKRLLRTSLLTRGGSKKTGLSRRTRAR